MKRIYVLVLSTAILVNSGCATVGQTTLFGAGIGAATGTGAGLLAQKSVGSAVIGAGIGALLVGAFSYLGAKDHEKKEAMLKLSLPTKNNADSKVPDLTAPDVVCYQVEGKLENSGTRWVGPHQVCEIKRQSVFSR
jgi:hypothetical protein